MAYGPPVQTEDSQYNVTLTHNPTGNTITFQAYIAGPGGALLPEATRDQLFQVFLTRLAGTANSSVVSSKNGGFTQTVTP